MKNREKSTKYYYAAYIAFLLFKGYYPGSIELLTSLNTELPRMHRPALAPYRKEINDVHCALGYWSKEAVSTEFTLLIWLLAIARKTIEEIKRSDLDSFGEQYIKWYADKYPHSRVRPSSRIFRVENFLVYKGIIEPRKRIFRHEEHFSHLNSKSIRESIINYMQ
jgi:hypothetical protein